MKTRTTLLGLAVVIGLGILNACSLLSPETSFQAAHPQELPAGRPMCTECHDVEVLKGAGKQYAAFNHTPTFAKDHRFPALQDSGVCATCHAPSFCAPCHAGVTVMKPSTLMANRPDRPSPHKGNYLTLHRIEGKMDPSSCFKCHGRNNNQLCTACHRK